MNNNTDQLSLFSEKIILRHIVKDKLDLYFDSKSGLTGTSINGLARLVDCDKKLIQRLAVTLNAIKNHEAYTQGGLQGVSLIDETDIPKILDAITNGKRTSGKNKESARKVQSNLVRAGFRLMVLLEVAPEQIAAVAIDKIKDPVKAQELADYAANHAKYLDTFWGLANQLKEHGAAPIHYATINKFNNDLVGIDKTRRNGMDRGQKNRLTLVQLAEEMKLEKTTKTTPWNAVNTCKNVGRLALEAIERLL